LPRYSYGVRRKPVEPEPEPEPTYRDLQAEAKELGVPANQSAEELKEAIAEHSDDE
jgi:hypothetical protein